MKFPLKHNAVDTTIFSVMSALAVENNAINLSQGFPDYPIDTSLQDFLAEATQNGFNQYAPMAGLPLLLEQISKEKTRQHGVAINPSNITICPGASYGIFVALTTLIEKGDEVIILEPAYDSYMPGIEMNGGVPISIPLNYPDFSVDWYRLKEAINSKTKAIIVNTPHNPTGVVWNDEDWRQLSELISGKNIFVISDEVYEQLTFDTFHHTSVIQQASLKDQYIAVYSFGKQFNATGWKIGYTIASEAITKAMRKVHQFIAFTVNTPSQYAIAHFMKEFPKYNHTKALQEKRNLLLSLLEDTPFKIHEPAKGTYFQIADFSDWQPNMTDLEFAKWLTIEVGVATIPLSAFYKNGKDDKLIRFCFAKKDETLINAIEKIKAKL